jgi:myo-inositol-1-phosphate synthase
LGILLPGLGAVATTFIAGVEAIRRGLAKPVGSLSQAGMLAPEQGARNMPVGTMIPLVDLTMLEFGAWDVFPDNAYEAAVKADVLSPAHLAALKSFLEGIAPWPAVFDERYVTRLKGQHRKQGRSHMALAEQVMGDIERFRTDKRVDRLVMIWCGSTEIYHEAKAVHASMRDFERGLMDNDPAIAPSMIYAYAAIKQGIAYANGTPNLAADIPALTELASRTGASIAGKDLKTGQSLLKTVLAPAFRARLLGVQGWYSTNILGNRDGEVLDDRAAFRTKQTSKLSVLDTILEPKVHPDLYGALEHIVRIDYYPPRGDHKESWDNIDIFGWMGYPMQLKVNFLCRDSILAAPLVLDLALFLDLAQRAGQSGIQDWLSFYFKSPMTAPGQTSVDDLFRQLARLEDRLRHLAGV